MKRSQAVSLVLLAGAGAAALTIANLDPSQKEEDALIYRSEGDCVAGGERNPTDCHSAFQTAQASYEASAPRYPDKATCEAHHGWANCRDATGLPGAAPGAFVPLVAAVMLGRRAAQNMPVQPLYNHGPEEEKRDSTWSSSGGGGYCTGTGGRVYASRSGASAARVSSAVARTTSSTPRVIARGGFGSTGHGFAAHSGGGFHATGSS